MAPHVKYAVSCPGGPFILDGMPEIESLSSWPFLLGLAILLALSGGIWHNLNATAKRFPQLFTTPQRWFSVATIALLSASIVTLGYDYLSRDPAIISPELALLSLSAIAMSSINGIFYAFSLRSLLRYSQNTREQLIQKQLLMQSVSQAQQNLLLKEQVRETKRQHLKSQMNPHFIFNVLTGIQNLLQEGQSLRASHVFSRFRRLLMLGFMSQDRVLGPLAREMDLINQYLELEQTRLSESIQFKFDIDSDVFPSIVPCPLFILQPLVENALWHGLSGAGLAEPTLVIKVHWQNQDLIIAVCDNGAGIRPKEDHKSGHKSRGTAIVKERLALLRHRGELEILDCPAGHPFKCGVMARMTLPLWALEPAWHADEGNETS